MRIGMDVQFSLYRYKTGLFYHHYFLVQELQKLVDEPLWLFLHTGFSSRLAIADVERVRAAFDGAIVKLHRPPRWMWRLRMWLSKLNRVDVFYHMWGGLFEPLESAGNVYLIPDLIPLKFPYIDPNLVKMSRRYYETAAKFGDVVIVSSEHTKADVVEIIGISPEKIRVAPLAPGPQFRPLADPVAVADKLRPLGLNGVPYVLCVCTLEPRKNHVLLLRAFARLKTKEPSLLHKLVLVGGKQYEDETTLQLIEQLTQKNQVIYLGYSDSLEYLYNGADLFVFPSLYEGFGLPPLEAMACGVPVIAANCTSVPEVVGDAGLLVDGYDEDQLCESMRCVLTDSALRRRLGEMGLRRSESFSWKRTAALYYDAFRFAFERHRS